MPERTVEVQRTKEIETIAKIMVNVPDAVLQLDDPEALMEWVEMNVSSDVLDREEAELTKKTCIVGADLIS